MSMQLLEQYEELVERNPSEISYTWKGAAIVAYLSSTLSAFACAILFSVFWAEICGGHCYFWSEIRYYQHSIQVPNSTERGDGFEYDWTEDIVVSHQSNFYCNWFHFTCLCSAAVAVIFVAMFMICGKGGYDTSLFVAPWRLVLPALICSLVMMAMTMSAVSSFTSGYYHFSEKLHQAVRGIMRHVDAPFKYNRTCEVFQKFTASHNTAKYDLCLTYWMIQICSWTMTWSWIGSFFVLLVRILMSTDFNLLKVKIYALPEAGPERDTILKIISEGKHSLTVSHSPDHRSQAAAPQRRRNERKHKVL